MFSTFKKVLLTIINAKRACFEASLISSTLVSSSHFLTSWQHIAQNEIGIVTNLRDFLLPFLVSQLNDIHQSAI
jgi:hypothetical protein